MNAWDLSCRTKLPPIGADSDQPCGWTPEDGANKRHACPAAGSDALRLSQANSDGLAALNSTSVSSSQSVASSSSPISPPFTAYSSPSSLSSPFNLSLSNSPASSLRSGGSEQSDDPRQTPSMAFATRKGSAFLANGTSSNKKSLEAQRLGSPSPVDRKARKKDQNRRAAYNYRCKKMEERNRVREEEMRLVYSRVCLIGYAEELDSSIMYILKTKTNKTLDKDGNPICFICPICLQSCDNTLNLRSHLNLRHYSMEIC